MRLQPDDILQTGDILVMKYIQVKIGSEWLGTTVENFIGRLPAPELVSYVERPDPVDYAAQVKILREALEMAKNGLEWWKQQYPLAVEECDYDALKEIDAALEQTK